MVSIFVSIAAIAAIMSSGTRGEALPIHNTVISQDGLPAIL